MKKLFLSMLAIAGLGVVAWAGIATGAWTKKVEACATLAPSEFCGGGQFNPSKLPKKKRVPIALRTWGEVTTDDGSVPPIVREIQVDFDKDGTLTTKGLGTCPEKKVKLESPEGAKKVCKKALIGTGEVKAIIEFKEPDGTPTGQPPIEAFGPLSIFNGPKKKRNPTVVFHTRLDEPLPTNYVTSGIIKNSKKKGYGKQVFVKVPSIVLDQGTFVGFTANVKKQVRVGKSKKNYLLSRCSTKTLKAEAEIKLEGEAERVKIGVATKCKQAKEPKKKRAKTKKGKRR